MLFLFVSVCLCFLASWRPQGNAAGGRGGARRFYCCPYGGADASTDSDTITDARTIAEADASADARAVSRTIAAANALADVRAYGCAHESADHEHADARADAWADDGCPDDDCRADGGTGSRADDGDPRPRTHGPVELRGLDVLVLEEGEKGL